MRAPGFAALALTSVAIVVATSMVACLGFGTVTDDSAQDGVKLPNRTTTGADASVGDDDAATPEPRANPPGTDAAAPDAAKAQYRAFVSSTTPTGNLGGVAGATALCNKLAADAKLGGTYAAWISVSGNDAIDRITSVGPWHLVTGELVAPSKAKLATGDLKHLIDKDEKGSTPTEAEDRVWTATGPDGRYFGPDCAQWTGAGSGLVGEARNSNTNKWTALIDEQCSEVNRVYCLEL
ncbi:MAG: Tryptophan synthase alpha chain [Labilithrix sp.]|nr:Tryptophan synthase alpha chain [Labilithrix sp.]